MKSALVLALAGSAVAVPGVGDFWDAIFGGGNHQGGGQPHPTDLPNFPPPPGGSGLPFPFPTAPGDGSFPPLPTGTGGGAPPFPFPSFPGFPGGNGQQERDVKPLNIDYQLAPTAAPVVKRREVKYRQLGGSALPPFSLLDPNSPPTAPTGTAPAPVLPTGGPSPPSGFPTPPSGAPTPPAGGPTAPFPMPTGEAPAPPAGTGPPGFPGFPGFPGKPTTMVTRGPRPTAAPGGPGGNGGHGHGNGQQSGSGSWWQMMKDFFEGQKGDQN